MSQRPSRRRPYDRRVESGRPRMNGRLLQLSTELIAVMCNRDRTVAVGHEPRTGWWRDW